MRIKRFRAENFRNIEGCDIEFNSGVNLLYGNNAQGKTNAIEGIYVCARGKSFRASEDKELIRFGAEGFRIFIEYEDKSGINTLEYALFGRERRRKKNGYKIDKIRDMIGSFKAVLFYPDDLGLIKDSPDKRRDFLNIAISQCYNSYIKINRRKLLQRRAFCGIILVTKDFYIISARFASWLREKGLILWEKSFRLRTKKAALARRPLA